MIDFAAQTLFKLINLFIKNSSFQVYSKLVIVIPLQEAEAEPLGPSEGLS